MVRLDFTGKLVNPQEFALFDDTKYGQESSIEINTLALNLSYSNPYTRAEKIGIYADLIAYIHTTRRHRELYTITSDIVGGSDGAEVPDGFYTATITVNNAYQISHTFLVYQDLNKRITEKLKEVGFKVDTSGLNQFYQQSDKYDYEAYSLLYSLLGGLERSMIDGDLKAATEAFVKANKVIATLQLNYETI